MNSIADVVFSLNADNTLLDTDSFLLDLHHDFRRERSLNCVQQYWAIVDAERADLGCVDYLGALQRLR
ncbi:hypothetical protein [Zhongshania borealis]|uniref:Uncharacterized protein n=1 Tax=Zhongshania borealis TaxID=889488 RepID=A0ABP7W6E9_9GAMM